MKKWIAIALILGLCASLVACVEAPATTTTAPSLENPTTAPTTAAPVGTTTPTTAPAPVETTAPAPTETKAPPATAPEGVPTDLGGLSLGLGSQMPDFFITDVDGNGYTLYEMLEEKQMVMLNFWFIDCMYCMLEFPSINTAYQAYSDKIGLLAVNPYDSSSRISTFKESRGFSFTMCQDPARLSTAFGIVGYPTTVIVDRNGVVCLVMLGGLPNAQAFMDVYAYFTAEDYETTILKDVNDIYK